jgi:hypothetical protein
MPCSKCKKAGHNRRSCKEEPQPEPQQQPEPQPEPQPQPNEKLDKKYWVCPACNLPLGNDHRPCICHAFNYSVALWEEECQRYGRELLASKIPE